MTQTPPFRTVPHDLVANLESAPYRFASTMPGIPHYYTLEREWDDSVDGASERFRWTVGEMRQHEVTRKFYTRDQRYFDVNGYQYWTMGDYPPESATLINRAPQRYNSLLVQHYESIAHVYDELWAPHETLRERYYAEAKPAGRVLDIGCGTGMLVEYCNRALTPEQYTGVDPSANMLAAFALKHPAYRSRLLRTTFEEYETDQRFDVIVAMFGSASHVIGADVAAKARHLLAPGGRAYLMFDRAPASRRDHYAGPPSPESDAYEIIEFSQNEPEA